MFLDKDSMSRKSLLTILNFLTPTELAVEALEFTLPKTGDLPESVFISSWELELFSKSSMYV